MYQHPSDWETNEGVIRRADAQGMGAVLMRPMTSGVFQRLMAQAFPQIDTRMSAGCCSIVCSRIRTSTWRWWGCAIRALWS